MYEIRRTSTRPNTDIKFYTITDSAQFDQDFVYTLATASKTFITHWDAVYKNTGLLVMFTQLLSEDQLVLTTILIWDSEESYNASETDPVLIPFWKTRDEYNDKNGIIVSKITTTI